MKTSWGRFLLGASIAVLSSGLTTVVPGQSPDTAPRKAGPVKTAPVQTPGEPKRAETRMLQSQALDRHSRTRAMAFTRFTRDQRTSADQLVPARRHSRQVAG